MRQRSIDDLDLDLITVNLLDDVHQESGFNDNRSFSGNAETKIRILFVTQSHLNGNHRVACGQQQLVITCSNQDSSQCRNR